MSSTLPPTSEAIRAAQPISGRVKAEPRVVRTIPDDVARSALDAFAKDHEALIRELAKR